GEDAGHEVGIGPVDLDAGLVRDGGELAGAGSAVAAIALLRDRILQDLGQLVLAVRAAVLAVEVEADARGDLAREAENAAIIVDGDLVVVLIDDARRADVGSGAL